MKPENYTHLGVCKNAVETDEGFSTFKTKGGFLIILEHTSYEFALEFIKLMIRDFPNEIGQINWDLISKNDMYGGANKIKFNELNGITDLELSPSTINYTYKSLSILKTIKSMGLDELSILEIGGGYGGQCKILKDVAPIFNIKINNYGIIDLGEASKLQKKYLSKLGYSENMDFYEFEGLGDIDISEFNNYDFLISVYSLGEFDISIQNQYVDNVIKNIKDYYVVWNTRDIHKHFSQGVTTVETPKTGPHNRLIISR